MSDGSSVGGMHSTDSKKKKLAEDSLECLKKDSIIKILFPDLYESLKNNTYVAVKMDELSRNCNAGKKSKLSDDDIVDVNDDIEDIDKKKTSTSTKTKGKNKKKITSKKKPLVDNNSTSSESSDLIESYGSDDYDSTESEESTKSKSTKNKTSMKKPIKKHGKKSTKSKRIIVIEKIRQTNLLNPMIPQSERSRLRLNRLNQLNQLNPKIKKEKKKRICHRLRQRIHPVMTLRKLKRKK